MTEKFLTSEMCKNRFLAYNLNKHHNISIYLFSALLLILTRRFSVRLENDLSIGLILMSTHRLSLRSNALMIMDHLYHILHVPPQKYSIQTAHSLTKGEHSTFRRNILKSQHSLPTLLLRCSIIIKAIAVWKSGLILTDDYWFLLGKQLRAVKRDEL